MATLAASHETKTSAGSESVRCIEEESQAEKPSEKYSLLQMFCDETRSQWLKPMVSFYSCMKTLLPASAHAPLGSIDMHCMPRSAAQGRGTGTF